MKFPAFALLTLMVCLQSFAAHAEGLTIGVVAPTKGSFALLGKQIEEGAKAQAEAAGNTILQVPETCEEDSGEEIAKRLISGGVDAAVGFLCSDSLQSALPALKGAGIPAITVSARSPVLFEDTAKHKWPLFSLAPAPREEAEATAAIIADKWAGTPFAIIDDGTINAHELAANIRLQLEGKGLEPVLADNFRPGLASQRLLIRRLAKAGVSEVYVAAARADIAVIAKDAAADTSSITVMGGETLLSADEDVPLTPGVLAVMPTLWRNRSEASAVVQALGDKGIVAEGYVLPAHAAAFIVDKAAKMKKKGESLEQAIATGMFATVLGPVSFDSDHSRKQDAFQLTEWRDGEFQPVVSQ
jgi:branched-chain amino acid transport system substrate-binding protein